MTAALALGTAQLDQAYGIANRRARGSAHDPMAILDAARERGIAWVDTAPAYGEAERIVGRYLARAGCADAFRVASKLPALPAGLAPGEVDATVRRAIDGTRERIGRDCVDAYLVHAAADLDRHGTSLVDALAGARERGSIARIGVSVYEPAEAERALALDRFDAIQYPFHLFDQRMREGGLAARLGDAGWLRFSRSALLQGLLALPAEVLPAGFSAARPWLERLHALAVEHETTPVALALGYAVHHSGAEFVVLGADDAEQVHAACDAAARPLPDGVAELIAREFADVPASVRDPRRWHAPEPASR